MSPADQFKASVGITGGNNLAKWLRGIGLVAGGGATGTAITLVVVTRVIAAQPPNVSIVPVGDSPQISEMLAEAAKAGATEALKEFRKELSSLAGKVEALQKLYDNQQTQINTFDTAYKLQIQEFDKKLSSVNASCSNIEGQMTVLLKFLNPKAVQ